MEHWKKKIKDLSIRKKIISCTYVILIPLMLILCMLLTVYSYSEKKETYQESQQEMVDRLEDAINLLQQEVNYLSLNLSINYEIREILAGSNTKEHVEKVELWEEETPIRMMEEIIYLKGYVKSISIYPENGVRPFLRCLDSSSYVPELWALQKSGLYEQAVEKKGEGIWIRQDQEDGELYQVNYNAKLVLCREIYDLAKKKKLAFISIGISEDKVRELCSSVLQEEEEGVYLLNQEGAIIAAYGKTDNSAEAYLGDNYKMLSEGQKGVSGGKQFFVKEIEDSACYVGKAVPQQTFWTMFREISYVPVVLMLGVLLGILPVMLFVSRVISRPLENLGDAMQQFQQGDFKQQLKVESNDEVGQVAQCFNHMVTEIEQLINKNYIMVLKKRESELAVLQAKINPHFLYNALDSIYWQAMSADDEETAESIYELSQLFRLVLGNGKEIVTVEAELQLLQRYLEIQKLRFMRQLEYHFDVEPEILQEKIPKLILQPFVENAVIHGMEKQEEACEITISGHSEDRFLKFQVRDTGVGMTEEQLEKIWEPETNKAYSSQRIGRYAIYNVKERLRLKYGDAFQLKIESKVGKGTQVTLVIPAGKEEEDEITDSGR